MSELKLGDLIDGRFELESFIGQGGMGEVWRAKQVLLGRLVALKVLRSEYSALPHLRRRFAREARAAASLSHEHIASIFDFGTDHMGRMFIAMEYIEGEQLARLVASGLSVFEIVRLARQLLAALSHAHARGVVHRDLKPENILIARDPQFHVGSAKLVDFGIATIASEGIDVRDTDHDQVVGTPLYMSPEQASGSRVLGPRTDLYNLGFVLYELIAGKHPFENSSPMKVMASHVHDPVPPLVARSGLVIPDDLERVILGALEKRPADRWATAAKMNAALEPIWLLVSKDEVYQQRPVVSSLEETFSEVEIERMGIVPHRARQTAVTVDVRPQIGEATQHSAPAPSARAAFMRNMPFVGRHQERDRLLEVATQVKTAQKPKIVFIDGETGVGKTRLLMWLKEHLEEHGEYRGHIGVFTPSDQHGMQGVKELFESLFRSRGLQRDALRIHLEEKLARYGLEGTSGETARILTEFLRPQATHILDLDEALSSRQNTRGLLFATLLRVLELSTSTHPRLLILDDMQWASDGVVALLHYLAVEFQYRQIPVMIVCLQRHEDATNTTPRAEALVQLGRYVGETVEHVPLEPMPDSDAVRLLNALLPCSEALEEIVTERAAGNPLHLLALMRYLAEESLLSFESGRWEPLDIEQVRAAVPPNLADVFRVRIRQVEERHATGGRLMKLLTRCAILGKRFSYEVVYELTVLEQDEELELHLDEDFDQLLDEGFITEVMGRGEDLYCFRHGLLRDVLLQEMLGPAQTKRLHRLAAQSIERVHALDVQHHAINIASHWYAARALGLAMDWYWRGAQMARRAFQTRQSLHAYDRVLMLMNERLTGNVNMNKPQWVLDKAIFEQAKISRSRYLRAQVYIGDLKEGLGRFDDAEHMYRMVVTMCGRPAKSMDIDVLVPLCQAWLGLGHISWQRGDFTAAHWAFEHVYEVLSDVQKAPDIAVSAIRGLARVAWHRGEFEASITLANRGYRMAMELNDDEARAECLWILGEVARMVADHEEANRYYERSLSIYQQAMIPTGIARNVLSMAQMARYQKDHDLAATLYERALEQYEILGDRRGQALCYNGLGELARFSGEMILAKQHYMRALEILESIGAIYDIALTYTNLGLIQLKRRDFLSAEHYLLQARGLIADKDFPYVLAGIEYNLALVKARKGEQEESSSILRTVIDLNNRIPMLDIDYAEPLEQLAGMWAEAGSVDEAIALWGRARDIYRDLKLGEDLERVEQKIQALERDHVDDDR